MASLREVPAQSTSRMSGEDLKKIEGSENDQRRFREWIMTSQNFSRAEKDAINCNTVTQFRKYWEDTSISRDAFENNHQKGCGLWVKRYQKTAVLVQEFMEDFNPIVEFVTMFAAPYGGIAVGTISVLFAVARSKDRIEESLASAISAIKDRLPGLDLYQHIYNEEHPLDNALQARIVSAYQGFIDVCIAATKYYKSGGPRRWLRALGMSDSFLDKANVVQQEIVDIRRLCDELLSKKVHSIKVLNETLKQQLAELQKGHESLQKSNRELQKAQDDHCLHDVQRLLGLEIFSTEEHERNWDKHGHTLSFDDCLNAFQQMKGSELDAFRASDHYRTWISSEEACLLILSGHNDQSILYGTDQCWLSPVAIAAVNDLSREKSRNVYSYYTFPRDRQLIYGVLPIILLQLLRQKSHALRDGGRYDELCAELHKFREYRQLDEPAEKQRDDMVSTIEKAALRVIDFFEQSEVVYIIIDRADRCWSSSRIDHRYLFLKTLVKMVEAARSKLRVLVIIDGSSWQVQKHRDELGENTNGRVIIHTAHQGESGP